MFRRAWEERDNAKNIFYYKVQLSGISMFIFAN